MATKKKTNKKKPAAKRSLGKGPPKKKAAKKVARKKVTKKAPAKKKAGAKMERKHGPRADYGASIDVFLVKQPSHLRAIIDELRRLIDEVAPEAEVALKWGMPFYSIDGEMMCAIGSHTAHVNLILSGPPGTFDDPEGQLTGEGKTGRHLKLTSPDELPGAQVRGWLRAAAALARTKALASR